MCVTKFIKKYKKNKILMIDIYTCNIKKHLPFKNN